MNINWEPGYPFTEITFFLCRKSVKFDEFWETQNFCNFRYWSGNFITNTTCMNMYVTPPPLHESLGLNAELRMAFFTDYDCISGIVRKLEGVAKKKGYETFKPWIKAIVAHLHYIAKNGNGNPKLNIAIWKSCANHIANIHVHEGNPLLPKCLHGDLSNSTTPWLEAGNAEISHTIR